LHNPPSFDGRWKLRALNGETHALDQLVDAALEPLFGFCFCRLSGNRHLCEDVVQETLVRAMAELANYEPQRSDNNVLPWLTGLARNEIRRALARHSATNNLAPLWTRLDEDLRNTLISMESSVLDDASLQREETREMVIVTMSNLPDHYREVLESKYVLRRSVREIASQRQTSEKAIESLLSRARQAFRDTFLALMRSLPSESNQS
jgi:RNA polymerase sigma-70 factor (ECF subfamily)